MKKTFKVLKVVAIVIFVIAVALVIFYLLADNMPTVHKGYNEKIETGGAIEAKYLQAGPYETSKTTAKAEDPIKKYTVYYPSEMETTENIYPMI